ncbi:MAG TPA: hypothetical protein VFO34_04980 [Candidatus Acidoferrales bacterium]|nr:hypothetical protein [Candidatus Acidoferrales bacterium]
MYILLCVVIGIAVGWLTGRVLKGNQYGPAMDIVMGMTGAVGAEVLLRVTDFSGRLRTITAPFIVIFGAVAMTVIAAYINGRRRYAGY